MSDKLASIGDVAYELGTSVDRVRYCLRSRGIQPDARIAGGVGVFRRSTVERIRQGLQDIKLQRRRHEMFMGEHADAAKEFKALVEELVAQEGLARIDAVKRVARAKPELHEVYLRATNPQSAAAQRLVTDYVETTLS